MFFLGALLIVLIQHLINDGLSQSSGLPGSVVSGARKPGDALEQIVSQAGQIPTSHIYSQLSNFYEDRGEYRKALHYLRLANSVAETEEEME